MMRMLIVLLTSSFLSLAAANEQPISQIIKKRIVESGASYKGNDSIAAFIEEEELSLLVDEVARKMEDVLSSLVIDTENDPNTKDTARRVAKMYVHEIFRGRYSPSPKITSFPNTHYKDLYLVGPITIRTTCAHHLQSIKGRCWIGIIPGNNLIGLSKFHRLIHHIAERPQIQETMTAQIAQVLSSQAKTEHVAVLVEAKHGCVEMRGVKDTDSRMVTSVMLGAFETDSHLQQRFYSLCQATESGKE